MFVHVAFAEISIDHFRHRPLDVTGGEPVRQFPFDDRRQFDPAGIPVGRMPAVRDLQLQGYLERLARRDGADLRYQSGARFGRGFIGLDGCGGTKREGCQEKRWFSEHESEESLQQAQDSATAGLRDGKSGTRGRGQTVLRISLQPHACFDPRLHVGTEAVDHVMHILHHIFSLVIHQRSQIHAYNQLPRRVGGMGFQERGIRGATA